MRSDFTAFVFDRKEDQRFLGVRTGALKELARQENGQSRQRE